MDKCLGGGCKHAQITVTLKNILKNRAGGWGGWVSSLNWGVLIPLGGGGKNITGNRARSEVHNGRLVSLTLNLKKTHSYLISSKFFR